MDEKTKSNVTYKGPTLFSFGSSSLGEKKKKKRKTKKAIALNTHKAKDENAASAAYMRSWLLPKAKPPRKRKKKETDVEEEKTKNNVPDVETKEEINVTSVTRKPKIAQNVKVKIHSTRNKKVKEEDGEEDEQDKDDDDDDDIESTRELQNQSFPFDTRSERTIVHGTLASLHGPMLARFLLPTVWFAFCALLTKVKLTSSGATLVMDDSSATQELEMNVAEYAKIKPLVRKNRYYKIHAVIKRDVSVLHCMVTSVAKVEDPNEITFCNLQAIYEHVLWTKSVKTSTLLSTSDTDILTRAMPILSIRMTYIKQE